MIKWLKNRWGNIKDFFKAIINFIQNDNKSFSSRRFIGVCCFIIAFQKIEQISTNDIGIWSTIIVTLLTIGGGLIGSTTFDSETPNQFMK